jgi:hypothetical protein
VSAVRITVRNVGQAFACQGVVCDASSGRVLAVTQEYPYGQRSNAYSAAEQIMADRGWRLAEVSESIKRELKVCEGG